jgi:putative serine protease PepD
VTSATDATAQVRARAAGDTLTVTYLRDGQEAETVVTLGALE